MIGFGLMGVHFLAGLPFLALAGYFFTKADKQAEEKDQDRRIRMKEKELKEKEIDSKIKKAVKAR